MHTLQVHTAGDDVRGASLRPRQPWALYQLQVLQNNFCRRASGAPWYVRNDILHRDLELPTISKYMQDMSKSSSTQLLTIPTHYYKQPYPTSLPPHHFIRRPRNVLSDPPDELTAEVERLTNINKDMTEL
ncbi:hypothetical protein EVAR_3143_1 [Eumeta japonica]|uniref:Uncharacterized protein n=1 Tax=Eumeta variegata TaxID=151549 RepID=A0A4C1XET8_EUMVA|nr:hypothetical protein EVAR_3143_1 [Eumeta japonica]